VPRISEEPNFIESSDYPFCYYRKNKPIFKLIFLFTRKGYILYHSLDMVKGTFEIRNTSKKLVAEVLGVKIY